MAANGKSGLATVALRPSGIFGEGDPLLVPTIVAKAKQGKMGVIIGSGRNLMDFTYVGNVAQAHLQVSPMRIACMHWPAHHNNISDRDRNSLCCLQRTATHCRKMLALGAVVLYLRDDWALCGDAAQCMHPKPGCS